MPKTAVLVIDMSHGKFSLLIPIITVVLVGLINVICGNTVLVTALCATPNIMVIIKSTLNI